MTPPVPGDRIPHRIKRGLVFQRYASSAKQNQIVDDYERSAPPLAPSSTRAGKTPTIRVSVGIEDTDDLVEDFVKALDEA